MEPRCRVSRVTENSRTAEMFPPWPSYWNCNFGERQELVQKGQDWWNDLLREKGEIQTPVGDDTRLRNRLISVGHTHTEAETIWVLRKVGFVSPISLVSTQIGTRPLLDSAVLRGEVLLLLGGSWFILLVCLRPGLLILGKGYSITYAEVVKSIQ